ncbi:YaaL family protein [Paucilactobacillus nenjiangensis]|jgi:hypothetical protein|uniref:DUF2508 family protein n=1 Tax=Paucilactobacillus nenjiangensis TaxID=1296540 RepID=A0A5P1X3A3_9LACO|nr:YaaL family protein [Paucilactobacillus nenjiangensis]QER68003.1 DUF2508 family protein [Paucilactobacillus nenjiangensis]
MFNRVNKRIKAEYDDQLLELVYNAKASWDQAQETEQAVYESNVTNELEMQTLLQKQKYMYLFREARRREVHG